MLLLALPGAALFARVSIHWPPGQTEVESGSKCTFTVKHADKLPRGWRWFITAGAHGDLVGKGENQAIFTAPGVTKTEFFTIRVEDRANSKDFRELVVPVVVASGEVGQGAPEKKDPIAPSGDLGDYFKTEGARLRRELGPEALASAERLERGLLPLDASEVGHWPGIPNAFHLCYMNVEIKLLARLPALDRFLVDQEFDRLELAQLKAKLRKMINLIRGGRASPAHASPGLMACAQMEFLEAIHRFRTGPEANPSLFAKTFVDFGNSQKSSCQFRIDLMTALEMSSNPELCFEGYRETGKGSESKAPSAAGLETALVTRPILAVPAMVGLHGNLKSSNQAFERYWRPQGATILVAPPFFMAEYERFRITSTALVLDHQPMRFDPTLVVQLPAHPSPPGPRQGQDGPWTPVAYEAVYAVSHVGASGRSGHFIGYAKGSDGAWFEHDDDRPACRLAAPPQETVGSRGLPQARMVSVLYAKVEPGMSAPDACPGRAFEGKDSGSTGASSSSSSSSSSSTGARPRSLGDLPSELHTRISELAGTAPGFRNVSQHFNQVARNTPDSLTISRKMNDQGLSHLLAAHPRLKVIRLRGKGRLTNAGIVRALGQCPDLAHLDNAEGCLTLTEILDLFRTHEKLTGLSHSAELSDEQLALLPVRLESLSIRSADVRDETISRFDALKTLHISTPMNPAFRGDRLPASLTDLTIQTCPGVTGQGLPRELVRLTLASAPAFDGRFVLPRLQHLSLAWCDKVSLAKLRDSLLSSPLLTSFSSQRINAACLAALPARITHLSLMNCGTVPEGAFARFTRLEALSVHGAAHFSGAHLPATLRKLKVECCETLRSENLGALPLSHLDVHYCPGISPWGLPSSLVQLIINYREYPLPGHP